jgi:hypothetical protein
MNYFTFSFIALPIAVNGIELGQQIKAVDPLAELAITRNTGGQAVEIVVSTTASTQRPAFAAAISAHSPTKPEAETAAEANEQVFRGQVITKLSDTDFKTFVETELSKLEPK